MGRKKTPGLFKRGKFWRIDKYINGCRIQESTNTCDLEEAEKFLARKAETIRQAAVYGVRPKRTFRQAATKFLMENQHKTSLHDDACAIREVDKFIGDLPLESVHMGSLQPFVESRRKDGVKNRTINSGLQIVRHILNLAAGVWLDEFGLTWLVSAPKIKLLPETDKRKPYPLTWEEQDKLFSELPPHLKQMALFAVNTGCRDAEIRNLRWEWEIKLTKGSVFIVPGEIVKNREDRLVVLNDAAQSVIESVRGQNSKYVFVFRNHPIQQMMTAAWQRARIRAGLPHVRVHDLKHTFGRRLRAAGICFEDRQDLLGHKSGRITTHYSAAELSNLIEAANKACSRQASGITLRAINWSAAPAKVPMGVFEGVAENRVSA